MKSSEHPEDAAIVQYLDEELSAQEQLALRHHLQECAACSAKQAAYARVSEQVFHAVNREPVTAASRERVRLAEALRGRVAKPVASGVLRRFGWGMGIAAMLALGLLLAPGTKVDVGHGQANEMTRQVRSLEVNGETFIALPYSNPDLPVNAARVVEMEIPASALAEAGITFAPPENGAADATVAANVLLGIDGQPLGLHVLGMN